MRDEKKAVTLHRQKERKDLATQDNNTLIKVGTLDKQDNNKERKQREGVLSKRKKGKENEKDCFDDDSPYDHEHGLR